MTINLNTAVLAAQAPEVAVAAQPFSAGTPVFRRPDGKLVPISGAVTLAQASLQNVTASPVIKSEVFPGSTLGSSTDYNNRMVEAGGMLFMVYRSSTELRTCWATKDGVLGADLSLAAGTCFVSDIVTDGTNIAVLAIIGSQLKIFFFNAAMRANGLNGQVLTALTIPGATASAANHNHAFDPVSGYLYCGWLSGSTLSLSRVHIPTGAAIPAVVVATGVGAMNQQLQSRTRSFDIELFASGKAAVVYKTSATADLNFVVYDMNLAVVGATRTATAASIGQLGSYSTRRISALGDDKVCWGTQTGSKAVLFLLSNTAVLTSLLTVPVSAVRSSVMGRLSDGTVAFAFSNDSTTMDLSIVKTDGTLVRRGATIVNSVGTGGSHLIVPFADRFLLLVSGASVFGHGAVFLNDGTAVSQTKLSYSGTNAGYTDAGWSACKVSASGNAAVVHGTFFRGDADYNYYTSLVLSLTLSGSENYRYYFSNETTTPIIAGHSLLGDGMQALSFGQNGASQHCLTRFVFEQCVFSGIAGSHCPNVGDLSYVFGKGTYRINQPNAVFNYTTATPIAGVKGNISSGVLTLN